MPLYSKGLCTVVSKADVKRIEKTYEIPEKVSAPKCEGDSVGSVVYTLDGEEIGRCDIFVGASVERIGYLDILGNLFSQLVCGKEK